MLSENIIGFSALLGSLTFIMICWINGYGFANFGRDIKAQPVFVCSIVLFLLVFFCLIWAVVLKTLLIG